MMVEKPQDVNLQKICEIDSPEELYCFDDPEPGDFPKMPKVIKPSQATYCKSTFEEIQLELKEMRKKLHINQ
jgi:hypothetical protein